MSSRRLLYAPCLLTLLFAACDSVDKDFVPPLVESPPQSNLPPDPGDAGTATVAGIDSDGDGVRDDIQRYIAFEYPDSAKQQAALNQLAIALQEQLVSGQLKEEAVMAASRTVRAVECLSSIEPNGDIQFVTDAATRLQAEILNTQSRWDAYRLFDEQLWGEVVASVPLDQQDASCAFDAGSLPN